jgi:hypothetical protein
MFLDLGRRSALLVGSLRVLVRFGLVAGDTLYHLLSDLSLGEIGDIFSLADGSDLGDGGGGLESRRLSTERAGISSWRSTRAQASENGNVQLGSPWLPLICPRSSRGPSRARQ